MLVIIVFISVITRMPFLHFSNEHTTSFMALFQDHLIFFFLPQWGGKEKDDTQNQTFPEFSVNSYLVILLWIWVVKHLRLKVSQAKFTLQYW